MKDWEIFEKQVCKFLNENYSKKGLKFINFGGSDSFSSDIKIYRNGTLLRSIEAKLCPSQGGQIVILPDDNKFVLSNRSVYKGNPHTLSILEHMNNKFNYYNRVSTSGIYLTCDKSILFNWIKYHYKEFKSSDFIIAGHLDNNKNINLITFIPILDMDKFFTVECPYRKKRSGTTELPLKYEKEFLDEFTKFSKEKQFKINSTYWTSSPNKLFIELDTELSGANLYLECSKFTSYLSFKENIHNNYKYEVRKRSNTNNPNTVFQLDLLNSVYNKLNINLFEDYLDKL